MEKICRPMDVIYLKNSVEMYYILTKWMPEFLYSKIELAGVMFLDDERKLLETNIHGIGNSITACFHADKIVERGKSINAKFIVVFHNHPNYTANPSDLDNELYRGIRKYFQDSNLVLLDSIIIGGDNSLYTYKSSEKICQLDQFGEIAALKKKFANCPNYCPSKVIVKDSKFSDKVYFSRFEKLRCSLLNTWGVYERWETETARPFSFRKDARIYKSTGPDYTVPDKKEKKKNMIQNIFGK